MLELSNGLTRCVTPSWGWARCSNFMSEMIRHAESHGSKWVFGCSRWICTRGLKQVQRVPVPRKGCWVRKPHQTLTQGQRKHPSFAFLCVNAGPKQVRFCLHFKGSVCKAMQVQSALLKHLSILHVDPLETTVPAKDQQCDLRRLRQKTSFTSQCPARATRHTHSNLPRMLVDFVYGLHSLGAVMCYKA